jgi:hypothetical protein
MWKWLGVLVPWMLACAGAGEPKVRVEAPTCCETTESMTSKPFWTNAGASQCARDGGRMVQKVECEPTCCAVDHGAEVLEYEMLPQGSCQWYYLGWNGRPAEVSLCQ